MVTTLDEEREEASQKRRRSGDLVIPLPLIFSVTAVVVSLVSLFLTYFHSPLRPQLNKYDFSTPKNALVSISQMELNGDLGSQIALNRIFSGRTIEEKAKTLKVHKEAEWAGNKILFVSYSENGVVKQSTDAFTKDAETGFWKPSFVSSYNVDETDKKLAASMREWTMEDLQTFSGIADQLGSASE